MQTHKNIIHEYEENEYYNQEYDPYTKMTNKNAPIVNVEKKLFVCNNVTDSPNDLTNVKALKYPNARRISHFLSSRPDSGEYIPCNDERCPFIDESDFGVQIFKDVATVRESIT